MVNTKKEKKTKTSLCARDYIKNYVNGKIQKYINAGPNTKKAIINNINSAFRRKNIAYYDYENNKITNIIVELIINNNLSYEHQRDIFPEIDKLICGELEKFKQKEYKSNTHVINIFNAYQAIITKYEFYYAKINYHHFNCALYNFYEGNLFYSNREQWIKLIDSKKFNGYYYYRMHHEADSVDINKNNEIYYNRFKALNEKITKIKEDIDFIAPINVILFIGLIVFALGSIIFIINLYQNHIYNIEKTLDIITSNQNNINNVLDNYINSKKYLNLF